MTSVTMQRELVINLKKETYLNVGLLGKLRPMPLELHRQIFSENGIEKLTQPIFNQLSHYLVAIIDHQVAEKFTWPLYDTKTERVFRGQLSAFVNDYSSRGLLSPVMSSYLVNPSCFKVTLLIFQMSQLAVKRLLTSSAMKKDSQKELYKVMSDKYKSGSEGFVENIDKETDRMLNKFNNFLRKREALEKIAAMFRDQIVKMEETLKSSEAQKFLDNIVDQYVTQTSLDENSKKQILSIKNVEQQSTFFDEWLEYADRCIEEIESKWSEKVTPLLELCLNTQKNTEALIARHTGEAKRSSYCIEYNHDIDEICTKELQNEVNTQQKYILKNIIQNEKLCFPNLVRGFLISISYILKKNKVGNEIFQFNEFLQSTHTGFGEIITALRDVNNRVMNADSKLQPTTVPFNDSTSIKEFEIPPLPDLSDIKANKNICQTLFNSFTPVTMGKHQFNLKRKCHSFTFTRPQSKPIITPFHQSKREDFLKGLVSCKTSSYGRENISQHFQNISIITESHHKGNEIITECPAGFTKHQIMRLLSTKKSSSSKKFRNKSERPDINIKKGGLFNESIVSNDSSGLYRSYSSPNLFENRDKHTFVRGRRKLSVMQEGSPSALDVSGIAVLDNDDSCKVLNLDHSRLLLNETGLPRIIISSDKERKVENVLKDIERDLNKFETNIEVQSVPNDMSKGESKEETKTETPKMNGRVVKKSGSLEKIINRFKKVRANVLPPESKEDNADCNTIIEEKEHVTPVSVDVFTANRILLPELLSPSCSVTSIKSDYLEQLILNIDEVESRKPRQSLGTALGVDNTFLDQFDLVD